MKAKVTTIYMDHQEAIQKGYPERYLLGELPPAQRDQFEEHFFDCPICSGDVQAGAVFLDNARAVLRTEEARAPVSYAKFGLPFQSAAFFSVGLAALLGYQNLVTIPGMRSRSPGGLSAGLVTPISLLGMGSRAESQAVDLPRGNQILLSFDVPGGPEFTSYAFQVLSAGKKVRVNVPIPAGKIKDVVTLAIPGSDLSPGDYELDIVGTRADGASQDLIRIPAVVK